MNPYNDADHQNEVHVTGRLIALAIHITICHKVNYGL